MDYMTMHNTKSTSIPSAVLGSCEAQGSSRYRALCWNQLMMVFACHDEAK